jgi:hypothetical protein
MRTIKMTLIFGEIFSKFLFRGIDSLGSFRTTGTGHLLSLDLLIWHFFLLKNNFGCLNFAGLVTHYDEEGIRSDECWLECLSVVVDPSLAAAGHSGCSSETPKDGVVSRREAQCGWDNMIAMFKISWRKSVIFER